MEIIYIKTEYIKLGQILKLSNLVSNGTEAKFIIKEGFVKVNDKLVLERGRKLYNDDIIIYKNKKYKVKVI